MIRLIAAIMFLGISAATLGMFVLGVLWDPNTAILRLEQSLAGIFTTFALFNFVWELRVYK